MRRKAISELLSVVIIIAIVLAAGSFFFAWTFSLTRTGSVQHSIQIVYSKLSYTTGSGWRVTVVVKNTGTVSTSDVRFTCIGSVQIYDNTLGGWYWRSEGRIVGSLSPGQTYSHTWQIRNIGFGKTYSFRIRVYYTDGAYKEYLISIMAQQG